MTINKKWYWALGSLAVIGAAFIYRRKGMDLWQRARNRVKTVTTTEN